MIDIDSGENRQVTEFRVLKHLDLFDAVLRENSGGAADGAQVEPSVALACLGHLHTSAYVSICQTPPLLLHAST